MAVVSERQGGDPEDEHCINFATLVTALRFTMKGLEDIVKLSMIDLHRKIANKCVGCAPCTENCLKAHNNNFKKWCNTCTKWKEELALFMRLPGKINRVQWKCFDSKFWIKDYTSYAVYQVANVFVHKCRDPLKSVTEDLLDMVSLFENCNYFTIGQKRKLLADVRQVRNAHFAHNPNFIINEEELMYCLDVLSKLLGDNSFKSDKKCKAMYKRICDLKKKEKRTNCDEISKIVPILQYHLHRNSNESTLDVMSLISSKQKIYLSRYPHPRIDWMLLFLLLCVQCFTKRIENDNLKGKGRTKIYTSF